MRSLFAVTLAGALLCGVAVAQPAPVRARPATTAATPTADVTPGALRGTVVASTGEPLRKVQVSLRPSGGRGGGDMRMVPGLGGAVQTSDASGNFAFESVQPGTYILSAQRPGYVRADYSRGGSGRGPTPVEVTSGGATTGITIRMTPQAVVSGKVTDEDGDPVMNASVQLIRERWVAGRRQQMPMNSDNTDDRGEYRLAGLVPGKYLLQVNATRMMMVHDPGQPRAEGGDQNYTPLFYPGVPEASQAQQLVLTPGQDMRGIDFRLRKSATWRVRGQVLDDSGKPAQNAGVMAVPADGAMTGARAMGMARGPEGRFEITGLTPGSYNLIVNGSGREEPRSSARQPVNVGNRDVEGIVLQMQRGFEISGLVRVDGVSGPPTLTGTMRVMLDAMEYGMMGGGGGSREANGQVKPDGTWAIGNVMAGKFRLLTGSVPDGMYLKAVMVGGQDITGGANITAAATGIEVVLGTKAPKVSGTVIGADKQPVASGTVFMVPDISLRDRPSMYKSAALAEGGTFEFRSVAPGQYTIYALPEVEDGAWYDPDFVRTLDGKGVSVRLAEGQAESVQVTLAQ